MTLKIHGHPYLFYGKNPPVISPLLMVATE